MAWHWNWGNLMKPAMDLQGMTARIDGLKDEKVQTLYCNEEDVLHAYIMGYFPQFQQKITYFASCFSY